MRLSDLSIRWRMAAICVLLVTVSVSTIGFSAYYYAKRQTHHQIEQTLQKTVYPYLPECR